MFKPIVIIMTIAAAVIQAEDVPNGLKTVENPDNPSFSTEESRDGSIELLTTPVEVVSEDSGELSKSGIPENTDMLSATTLISEQVKFVEEADPLITSSPKIKRSELESDRDVTINDDQKSDEVNSDSINDEKVMQVVEVGSPNSDNTEELGTDQPLVKDGSNNKENSEEKPEVVPNLGEISGRRMVQQDVVLDTKGRSGYAYDSENIDNMRAMPPRDFKPKDMFNPLDMRPTFKNDFIIPHYPPLPRPGMFYNPPFVPNPMLFNHMGSKEVINPINRRFVPGFDLSQSRSSEEIRTSGNAYPFQPPLTERTGEPANNPDMLWKLNEAIQLPKPQLSFSAERRSAYQRNFNQFGIPRFRRSADLNIHTMT